MPKPKLLKSVHPIEFNLSIPRIGQAKSKHSFLFLVSHLGSDYNDLACVLDANPRIEMFHTSINYNHPDALHYLSSEGHKLGSNKADYLDTQFTVPSIHGDVLLHNHLFSSSSMYRFCKFVYLVRPLVPTVAAMTDYSLDAAERYLLFRLRRMCEMAKNTPEAVLLTWNELRDRKGLDRVEEYLGLSTPLVLPDDKFMKEPERDMPYEFKTRMQDAYEKHLFVLRKFINP